MSVDAGERWPVTRRGEREPISRLTRRLIYVRDHWTCQFCFAQKQLLALDHIIPWSAGGPDTSDNLRSLCHGCNDERSNYRAEDDLPVMPVTVACDVCVASWVRLHGYSRFGRCIPGAPEIEAFCGDCEQISVVTDRRRLR